VSFTFCAINRPLKLVGELNLFALSTSLRVYLRWDIAPHNHNHFIASAGH
jgi:hypothetical protein